MSNKRELKLGEEYLADIRLAVVDKNRPPRVILCNINNGDITPLGDTLPYNEEYQGSIYKITPTDTGTYKWSGVILQDFDGLKRQYPFSMTYRVIK